LLYFVGTILGIIMGAFFALLPFFLVLFGTELVLRHADFGRPFRFALLIFKSVSRNLLRTSLTYLAIFVLVVVVVMVWSTLYYLDGLLAEKGKDLNLIVTERWQALSEMPFAYADLLARGAATRPGDIVPQDSMTWQFYFGTLDAQKANPDSAVIFLAIDPKKLPTMMNDLFDQLTSFRGGAAPQSRANRQALLAEAARRMEKDPRLVLMGRERMRAINKRVGERFKVTGVNFQDIDLEFEIAAMLPPGDFDQLAIMNRDYLNKAIDTYPRTHAHMKHPLADRSLNQVWLRVPDHETLVRLTHQVESSPFFRNPAVKCETLSTDIANQLDIFHDLIWGMRWLLSPAIVFTIVLVIANAISISVRQRRSEMAVLKVLGFRPGQILALVTSEGILIGAVSGFLACAVTYALVNLVLGRSMNLPLYIPGHAFWWGPVLGAAAALLGSLTPAWSATSVNVSDVFSKLD
jgi:putative ABC transport system permease protein